MYINSFLAMLTAGIYLCSAKSDILSCNAKNIKVLYAHIPPYTYVTTKVNNTLEIEGTITDVVREAVSMCCGDNVTLDFGNKTYHDVRDVEEKLKDEKVAFPAVKTGLTIIPGDILNYHFLPVMETTGSVLLIDKSTLMTGAIGHALLGCWPMVVLVLSSAGVAGTIIWILDRCRNSTEFPKPFISGSWEGIWWAYVTMTTVGYGDKVPKSIPARIFGFIWMFIGILLMSIFTATMTTSISASENQQFDMKGTKIGVKKGTLEQHLAYRKGSLVIEFHTFANLMDAVTNKSVSAGLIDLNYALVWINNIQDQGIQLGEIIDNKAVYGIILQGQSDDLQQCFAKQVSKSQFHVFDEMTKKLGDYKKEETAKARQTANSLLSGIKFLTIAIVCVWVVAVISCLLWEFLYYRPMLIKQGKPLDKYCSSCFMKKNPGVQANKKKSMSPVVFGDDNVECKQK